MALQDSLKKINIEGIDSKGIYFKDPSGVFKNKVLNKNDLKKLDYENIDIVLKFYFRNKQIKKTIKFHNITGLQAIKKASIERSRLKEELEETGSLRRKKFNNLNDIFKDYIELKSKALDENNIYSMIKTYDKWVAKEIGEYEIKKILTRDIQKIVNKILSKKLKPRTAHSIKQILRPVFNYAIDLNITNNNPAIKVKIPSYDNTVDFHLDDEKRVRLYNEILKYEPIKYRGIMLFLYFGRRLNEVLTLRWDCIDFSRKVYTIEGKYSKIRKKQEYPLIEPLEDVLLNITDRYGYIFKGEKTEHVSSDTFRRHWKKLLKKAGIEKMRIHDTRHLIGNTLVNKGESLENISKLLGHSSISVTKRYAKTTLATVDKSLHNYMES